MPLRLSSVSHFGNNGIFFNPVRKASPALNPVPLMAKAHASTTNKKRHYDPWALEQIKARKDANIARRKQLTDERKAVLGDPVRGISTPFIESLDTVGGAAAASTKTKIDHKTKTVSISSDLPILSHLVNPSELEEAIRHSSTLTSPSVSLVRDNVDPAIEQTEAYVFEKGYSNAITAMPTILSLRNASYPDRTRANVKRCVDTFGRHQTDPILPPRPPINPSSLGGTPLQEKTPRAGPDTGSSEVQIAILTVKIKRVADELEKKGGMSSDKIGKRNLRLLVHRRQKLLKYLRRKERGGARWQHVTEMLGLTEGAWQEEISL